MEELSIILRVMVSVIFLAAAVGKLANISNAKESIGNFGVKHQLLPFIATVVPILELSTVVLLAIGDTVVLGAGLAGILLFAFTAFGVLNLAQGKHPECSCFGRLSTGRIGGQWLIRNLLLLGLSALLLASVLDRSNGSVWDPLVARSGRDLIIYGLLAVAYLLIALLAAALFYVLRLWQEQLSSQKSESESQEPDGLPAGELAPPFELPGDDSRLISLSSVLSTGQPTLLLFMATHCAPCRSLVSDIHKRMESMRRAPQVLMLVAGNGEEFVKFVESNPADSPFLHQADWSVSEKYRITRTPNGVLVDQTGKIVAPTAVGWSNIENLLIKGSQI